MCIAYSCLHVKSYKSLYSYVYCLLNYTYTLNNYYELCFMYYYYCYFRHFCYVQYYHQHFMDTSIVYVYCTLWWIIYYYNECQNLLLGMVGGYESIGDIIRTYVHYVARFYYFHIITTIGGKLFWLIMFALAVIFIYSVAAFAFFANEQW